jgi:DHA1 family inner membrane transport protein
MATQSQVLHVAPGRTELALAANSAAFNAGVAAGALTGGALLHAVGVRGTFLVGGVLTLGALAVLTWPATGSSRAGPNGQGSGSAVGTIGDW